jgi:hypothetical protein
VMVPWECSLQTNLPFSSCLQLCSPYWDALMDLCSPFAF